MLKWIVIALIIGLLIWFLQSRSSKPKKWPVIRISKDECDRQIDFLNCQLEKAESKAKTAREDWDKMAKSEFFSGMPWLEKYLANPESERITAIKKAIEFFEQEKLKNHD